MASVKTVNYTADQVAKAVADYQAGVTVEVIADALGKSVKSVVAKLSREGVYVAKAKAAASAKATKAQLVNELSHGLGVDRKVFETLEKANYEALEALVAALVVAEVEVE